MEKKKLLQKVIKKVGNEEEAKELIKEVLDKVYYFDGGGSEESAMSFILESKDIRKKLDGIVAYKPIYTWSDIENQLEEIKRVTGFELNKAFSYGVWRELIPDFEIEDIRKKLDNADGKTQLF